MTQPMQPPHPAPPPGMRIIELPTPEPPMVTRVISERPIPEEKKGPQIIWLIGAPNPMAPNMRIVRMFREADGVDIYSVSHNGVEGARYHIPTHLVRFTEEAMPVDVLVDEIAAAEAGDDDEDDDGDPEPERDGGSEVDQTAAPSNGASS